MVRRASELDGEKWQEGGEEDMGGIRVATGLGPRMSRHGIGTEVATCRAMNLVATCKVAWMRKRPGQGGQAGPLNGISFELRHRAKVGNVAMNKC